MSVKILILGITGMLGHTLFTSLSNSLSHDIYGTTRLHSISNYFFPVKLVNKIIQNIKADNFESVSNCLTKFKPDLVINCIGIVKQLPSAKDAVKSISINALFPHRLALTCNKIGIRLIHISTDCVFSGLKGNYRETDLPDPVDIYGRTKLLGEVSNPNCITIRTSIIGHELMSRHGLVEWFLAQTGKVKGYTQAIFSGLPTIELAEVIMEHVINKPDLQGLYHVSAGPISKYQLLELIAREYQTEIELIPDDQTRIDRSLNSDYFRKLTGYSPPNWPELIQKMRRDFLSARHYQRQSQELKIDDQF